MHARPGSPPGPRRGPRWLRRLGLPVLLLLATGPAGALRAEPPAAPPDLPPPPTTVPSASRALPLPVEAGRGLRVYQPEFRAADELLEAVRRLRPDRAAVVQPVAPWVQEPRPGGAVPVPLRLLLSGPEDALGEVEALLRRLDLPDPMVQVDVTVAEVRCEGVRQSGGHLRYDRDASPGAPKTLYRGTASTFEPDAYLRAQLTGALPFAGTSVAFGRDAAGDGLFDYVLRALHERRESELLARTTLVTTEGRAAELASLVRVPNLLLSSQRTGDGDPEPALSVLPLDAGLSLKVLPVRVGSDGAVLDLTVSARTAEPSSAPDAPPGQLVLRARELTTRVTARDGETLAVGGLRLQRHLGDRRGLPLLDRLPALDVPLSARGASRESTELLFVLRVRILALGRGPVADEQRAAR